MCVKTQCVCFLVHWLIVICYLGHMDIVVRIKSSTLGG